MTVDELRGLWDAGKHDEHLREAKALALREPLNVQAQIEAAFGHDRMGLERDAVRYYEAAYELGVPEDRRRNFMVGFGSTLRNVGRADDAVAILARAIAEDPTYPPFTAFLALALADAGHTKAALGTMLGCALDVARSGAFDRYERALGEYHRLLLEPAQ